MSLRPLVEVIVGFLNFLIALVTTFLGLRFLLKFLGANPNNEFVNWVYENTLPLLEPFLNIFPSPVLQGQFVVEFSTLFAILVYSVLGLLLLNFLKGMEVVSSK